MRRALNVIRRDGEKGIHGIRNKPSLPPPTTPTPPQKQEVEEELFLHPPPEAANMTDDRGGKKDPILKEEEEPPPEKPLPGDCCGSGCERCVWDVYYEELEAYNNRQRQKKGKAKDDSSKP